MEFSFENNNYKATVKTEIFENFWQPCSWIVPKLELNHPATLLHLQSKFHENLIGCFCDVTDTGRHTFLDENNTLSLSHFVGRVEESKTS